MPTSLQDLCLIVDEAELNRLETGAQTDLYRPLTSFWWKKVFTSNEPPGFPRLSPGSYNGRHTHAIIRRGSSAQTRVLRWRLGHTGVCQQGGVPVIYLQLHPLGKEILLP